MMGCFGPKPDNKSVGERSQAIILAKLVEVGYSILIPFGENHRYDLVVEDGDGNFYCIQCNKKEPMVGLEPTARNLQGCRSTTELHRLIAL
jgi:hypothetical protein